MSIGIVPVVLIAIGALAVGGLLGLVVERRRISRRRGTAEDQARQVVAAAEREAQDIQREAERAGRDEARRLREEWEKETERRRAEIERVQERAVERDELLDRKFRLVEERQGRLDERQERLDARKRELEGRSEELSGREREIQERLEKVSGISREEARQQLVGQIQDEARAEARQTVREVQERARREAEREAKKIISLAIQKLAVDHSSETTVSVVSLPSDDMKGRIIGREGRNIRSFEAATGVDVVVDDTPEAVILSSFDPVRREVARLAMERLVADGRIHPGRIEEMVEKAGEDVQESMREAAEEVLYELGIHDLDGQLVETLGHLRFRTSYGQNQLQHAREVALIAANMAAELNLDVQLTKRMGLLHDIGKGLTHEREGSHVELGYELCRRCGEGDEVLNAIRAHHGEEPAKYPETFLVTAADAISGARPGARRESFEHYVKRLEKLEQIAGSFEGVEKVYAIQAGREIRIMVTPDRVSDEDMARLGEETARRIENELQYPGQIKVVVVRETRSVDFARERASGDRPSRARDRGGRPASAGPAARTRGGDVKAKLIDGRRIAGEIRAEAGEEAGRLASEGFRPGLGVVLVGEDPASQVYVRMKTRACAEAGIHTRDVRLAADIDESELLAEVDALNEDPEIHGILVQLPLPGHLDERRAMERVAPEKDVDGFHPISIGRMASGDPEAFRPATPAGIQEMLRRIEFDPEGRHAVIVGRSNIVGKPMARILLQKEPYANATVTVAHSRTRDLPGVTRQAELLIVAVGRPEMVRGDWVREGAVVIDVGVNRVPDPEAEKGYRLVGDVAFEEAAERASWITPVPGGVGPMTIAMLLRNTVEAARRRASTALPTGS